MEHVAARPLAAISTTAHPGRLGDAIIDTLNKIWPVLRSQGVRTGHNVVIYRDGTGGSLIIDVGVEIFSEVAAEGEITPIATPSGEAATIVHFGEYSQMDPSYAALEQWCASSGRERTGVNWEVYGDWDDDPARRRTDIFFGLKAAPLQTGDGLARPG